MIWEERLRRCETDPRNMFEPEAVGNDVIARRHQGLFEDFDHEFKHRILSISLFLFSHIALLVV